MQELISYHGASQDSHRRDSPGGGGVSLNRFPPGSCLPSDQKLLFSPPPRTLIFLNLDKGSRLKGCIEFLEQGILITVSRSA